jgi:hypothetical protein
MEFEALLRAHGFMKVERPPELWAADTEDTRFVPLLGEMIAASLSQGIALADLTLNVSNVVVDASGDEDDAFNLQSGDYVAVTVLGNADLGPDASWAPAAGGAWVPASAGGAASVPALAGTQHSLLTRLHDRLLTAGVVYAYVRRLPPQGSITVFLPRLGRDDCAR